MSLKKLLIIIFRILVGVLFIVSGLVKANDPLGLSYKMDEFFQVLHLHFMVPVSLELAVVMIAFEIIAGFALLLGFKMRFFGPLLLALMVVFTFITGFAYLSGKITECGCFGDCLPISAGASFWKDVILLILVFFLYRHRRSIRPFMAPLPSWVGMLAIIAGAFGLQRYVLNHLPIVDCLPYKVGNNIPELMTIPPGAIPDKYETIFIYEKDGEEKEFPADQIPWQDTTWHYVDRRDKLVQKGNAQPKIKDFVIADFQGNDSTDFILDQQGYVFLFMVKQTTEAGEGWAAKIQHLQTDCARFGIRLYGVTASAESQVAGFRQQNGLHFPFLQMDGTAIKTAARSNPCLILLKQGVIKGKWHFHDMPQGAVPSPENGQLILKY